MRKLFAPLVVLLITFFSLSIYAQPQQFSDKKQVYFSPHGGCTQAIVDALNGAKKSVLVQAYSFTSYPIADALIGAHRRGVKVKVILDKSQINVKGGKIDLLANDNIPVSIDTTHAIPHSKVMIIDGQTVITGSFNFTNAAEDRNAENLLIIKNKTLASKYRTNWNKHSKHSEPYSFNIMEENKTETKPAASFSWLT